MGDFNFVSRPIQRKKGTFRNCRGTCVQIVRYGQRRAPQIDDDDHAGPERKSSRTLTAIIKYYGQHVIRFDYFHKMACSERMRHHQANINIAWGINRIRLEWITSL